ncbi:MAG: polysaccharide deacetylase family protein, partial [Saprospiraceae bacterium]
VLDILRVNNIKAIFFCIGKNVEKYPELTRQIIAEGHQIGNHTFNHDVSGTFADSKKYILEITSTNDIIEKVTGIKPIFFRPPFGVTNPSIAKAVIKSGMQLMAWNLRTFDTVAKDPSAIVKKLQNSIRPSSIILMHDTNPQCVEALTLFFPLVKTNGN